MTNIAVLIQIVVQIAAPLALGWWLVRRYGGEKVDSLRIFLGGMLGYAVAQVALLAASQLVSFVDVSAMPEQQRQIIGALGFGLGVGVLEELARYGVLRLWLRDVRSWGHGLIFGAGHGGSESIFTGVIGAIWYMTMQSLRLGPPAGETLSEAEMANLDQVVSAYLNAPWQMPLLSAAQQVCMIVLSLALATLVMRVFLTGRPIYLPVAMIVHGAAATSIVYLGSFSMPLSALVAGAFAVLAVIIVARYAEPTPVIAAPVTPPAAGSLPATPAARPRRKRAKKT